MYKPTAQDALNAYYAAAAGTNNYVSPDIDPPHSAWLSAIGSINVRIGFKRDADGQLIYDENHDWIDVIIVCLYDKKTRLWLVKLQDSTLVRVRDTGDGFVVVADEE